MNTPDRPERPRPGRDAALQRIAAIDPHAYARTRNALGGNVTGLSPYFVHGLVTPREVLSRVLQAYSLPINQKLVYEFGWRAFFRHVWQHEGEAILHSLHSGPLPDDAYLSEVPVDIRTGCTGVPFVDQAVRELYRTGTLHNHARMWLASYVIHMRRVHWRAGADWLVAHLLDGDLASNHLSWQWVAGTGSSKPYLFDAANVARYAPAHWHSPGSVIDQPLDVLEAIARGVLLPSPDRDNGSLSAVAEPALLTAPPAALSLSEPDPNVVTQLNGRHVWLVHPWALRAPPASISDDLLIIGVYLRDYHQAWPWCEARWQWVDAAMGRVAQQRWHLPGSELAIALAGAASVRSYEEPHLAPWLSQIAELITEPSLFPIVERRCTSFSQWWKRATRGLQHAEELL